MNMKTDIASTTIPTCLALLAFIAPRAWAEQGVRFSNASFIRIYTPTSPQPDGSVAPVAATPYPCIIDVASFAANEPIAKITVTLRDISHATPDDIDILLVGPTGQNLILLSDAGGGFVDPNLTTTVTLDDEAQEFVPDNGPIVSGAFKPSNYELDDDDVADVFPEPLDENGSPTGPAPEPSSATKLSAFAGTLPNGEWRLYVVDDNVLDAGSIVNGWILTIWTGSPSTRFLRGDSNQDGAVNITDAVATLTGLFRGGSQPACADAADADDDGSVSLTDAVYTLNHLFRGGPTPPAPGPETCGVDPTEDGLACDSFPPCRTLCHPGFEDCSGGCRNLVLDNENCGACGVVCPEGTYCQGSCVPIEPCCGI